MAGRLRGLRLASACALTVGMVAALLAGVVTPRTAGAAPGHSVELRVLVLSVGDRSADTELDLIAGVMDNIGVPYDVLDVLATDLTVDRLRTGDVGRYNGVIITDAELGGLDDFSIGEWSTLHEYERDFNVRESVLSGFPTTNPGVDYGMTSIQGATTSTGAWTTAGASAFPYVGPEVPFINQFGFTAMPRNTGGVVGTVLMEDAVSAGRAMLTDLRYSDGRRVLLSTLNHLPTDLHSMVMAYAFIDFATQGLHIGAPQVHLAAHIDDLFLASEMWDVDTDALSETETYRTTAADISAAVAAQDALIAAHPTVADFAMEMTFNGVGLAFGDPLTQAVQANQGEFTFLNHTYSHPNLDTANGADQAAISFEIAQNAALWQSYGFPGLPDAGRALVTGQHSGLSNGEGAPFPGGVNPGLVPALVANGIDYIASDTSSVNQDTPTHLPGSGVLTLPRYPTNVFYNVRTPAQMVDEFNVIQTDLPDETYGQILDREADATFRHMASFSDYPHFFHAANLHDYDGDGNSLMSDWLTAVLTEYERYMRFPVLNLPYVDIGDRTANRLAAPSAGVAATLAIATGDIVVDADSWVDIRMTGVDGGATYGSQQVRELAATPVAQLLRAHDYTPPNGFPLPPTPTSEPTPTATPDPSATPGPIPTPTPTPGAQLPPTPEPVPFLCNGLPATIVGTDGPDTLVGTDGPDVIVALGGDDTIVGGAAADVICAGSGADTVDGGPGADIIFGQRGRDEIRGGAGGDTISGGSARDTIDGQSGRDTISGGSAADTIRGGRHADTIDGGTGRDVILGGKGPDDIDGGGGRDTISGNTGGDTIDGGRHADTLDGGKGTDSCTGGTGADTASNCETRISAIAV
ncbi:MAG: calcium-binding protein [Actinomycetota bacterium]